MPRLWVQRANRSLLEHECVVPAPRDRGASVDDPEAPSPTRSEPLRRSEPSLLWQWVTGAAAGAACDRGDDGRGAKADAGVQPARQASKPRMGTLPRSSSGENLPRSAKEHAFGFAVDRLSPQRKLARSCSDNDLSVLLQVAAALASPRPLPPATEHIPVVYRPF